MAGKKPGRGKRPPTLRCQGRQARGESRRCRRSRPPRSGSATISATKSPQRTCRRTGPGQAVLEKYHQEYTSFDASKSSAEKPTPPDFAALAGTHMTAHKPACFPLTPWRTSTLEIGQPPAGHLVFQYLFGPTTFLQARFPNIAMRFRYRSLLCLLEDRRPARPCSELEGPGVQDEVLRVWKLDEARKLAERARS